MFPADRQISVGRAGALWRIIQFFPDGTDICDLDMLASTRQPPVKAAATRPYGRIRVFSEYG